MRAKPYLDPNLTLSILLAGGRGSRLYELCDDECKPALPFAGGRLIDMTLANLVRSRLDRVLVATQYRPATLETYLDHIWAQEFPAKLVCRQGPQLQPGGYKGTADAVRANLPEIVASGARYLLILSGDHVYQMDYREMIEQHAATGAMVTVAVDTVPLQAASSFGVLASDSAGRIAAFTEKPRHPAPSPHSPNEALVSMGVYVIDLPYLAGQLMNPKVMDFGHDLLPAAVAMGVARSFRPLGTGGQPFYWRDVGTLDSYRQTALDCVGAGRSPVELPVPAARSEASQAAAARGTVLLPAASIAKGARVSNTIVAAGTRVPAGVVIGEDPEEDALWFRSTPGGTRLVTDHMLWQRAARRRTIYRVG